jgi:hypothetical protein
MLSCDIYSWAGYWTWNSGIITHCNAMTFTRENIHYDYAYPVISVTGVGKHTIFEDEGPLPQ